MPLREGFISSDRPKTPLLTAMLLTGLLVGWLFAHAGATRVQMPTLPNNVTMRTVLERLGFVAEGSIQELGQEFIFYMVTIDRWVGEPSA